MEVWHGRSDNQSVITPKDGYTFRKYMRLFRGSLHNCKTNLSVCVYIDGSVSKLE